MKNFKTIQAIAFLAIFCQQSYALVREKRSFFWPFGGSASADAAASAEPVAVEADVQLQPQQVDIPFQQLSPGYHYPIWRVHKYNGIELKPMPISLVPQQYQQFHTQQLHTQIPHQQFLQMQPIHQPLQVGAGGAFQQPHQQNGQQATNSCKTKSVSSSFPPELQDLADQFGIKDASKLPSLEYAMGLLGTTTRAETIQTIKELAATRDGMNLIRQFLASDEGAAASVDPNSNSQCDESTVPTQPRQPNNVNVQHRPIPFQDASMIPMPHQQYGLPPKQHEQYGLPNAQQAAAFHGVESSSNEYYPPSTNIMSLVKSEATVPHEEYGVPKSEQLPQHEIYGLPNVKQAVGFQQSYYPPISNNVESAKNDAIVPHQEYNVPSEVTTSDQPHQEYGVPSELSTAHSEHQGYNTPSSERVPQHEIYGLPNVKQAVAFQQGYYPPRSNNVESVKSEAIVPHQEYNVPNEATTSDQETQVPHQEYGVPNEHASAFAQHQEYNTPKPNIEESQNDQSAQQYSPPQHEMYGLPTTNQAVAFHQGHYPPKSDNVESVKSEAIVPHEDYGVPNEDAKSDHQTQVPHEVYGVPEQTLDEHAAVSSEYGVPYESHQTYGIPNHEQDSSTSSQHIENVEQDISVPHNEYSIPSDTLYALPHQRFFETPNVYRQSHYQQKPSATNDHHAEHNTQYGAPTQNNLNNIRTGIPILRQIDGTLDRTHTNLQLAQLLTTTPRPDAGFFERIGAWTNYLSPPGPTIPIVPPQVTEHVNEPANTHSSGHIQKAYTIPIPKIPDLEEQHITGLPITPQLPNMYIPQKFILPASFNQGPFIRGQANEYRLPSKQPQPFDGQTVDEFVPDVSQLPLDQRILSNDPRTSYGTPARQHFGDSSSAASEKDEQHEAVAVPKRSDKFDDRNDNESFVANEVEVEHKPKYGPQRISSYDSYATGKLNRADDDAIVQLIPTQKPSLYSNQARRLEDSSIIDAIATMTSGFRPIA